MTLADLFPHWRAASSNQRVAWQEEVELADDRRWGGILAWIAFDQSDASITRQVEFWPICKAVITDILALRAAPPEGTDTLNLLYLQFEAASVPLQAALGTGDLGAAHDWVVTGLGNDIAHGIERQIEPYRLFAFAASRSGWIADNRALTVPAWAESVYYLARRSATLRREAAIALPPVLAILDTVPPLASVRARCMILGWAVVYAPGIARDLARWLEAMFQEPDMPLAQRARIAVTLASNGPDYSTKPPDEWAEWAMGQGADALGSHEHFQLIWHRIKREEDWDALRVETIGAAGRYAASLKPLVSRVAIARATDQRSALLGPPLIRMTALGRSDDLLAILQHWYAVPPARAMPGGVVFVSPSHQDGTAWLGTRSQVLKLAGPHPLTEPTTLANAALGLAISVQGDAAPLVVPARPGTPNYALGPDFHAALQRAYSIGEVDPDIFAGRTALAMVPGLPHPIQALLLEARGETLPLTASLELPAPDRVMRRALIWSADNDLFAGFEPDAVERILGAAGFHCERRSGDGAAAEDFLAAYANPDFDLVWVAGHGEIDHWQHGSERLMIGGDQFVGIDALAAATPAADTRRLLILNICDGGVAAVNGGIHRVGLAPLLASREQAVVLHLWPVRPLVAAAFGALLAGGIVRGHGFFPAYAAALAMLRNPSNAVTEAVRELAPGSDLVERLTATNLETENLFNWGSPVFFE